MFLALREMRRSKARFALATGALTLLVVLVVGLQAMLGGLLTQFVGAIEHQSGEVVVFGEDARRNVEGSVVTDAQVAAVRAVPGVAAADPVVEGSLTVRAGGESVDAAVFGYRLGGVGVPSTLTAGRLPERAGEAVASEAVASEADREDGFDVGDRVGLGTDGPTVVVVGLAEETNYLTRPTLFVDHATAVDAKRAANPDAAGVPASIVAVDVSPGEDADAIAERITDETDGVEALTRAAAADATPGAAATSQAMWLIITVALVAAVVVVGFFFVILTVQAAPVHALLQAVGASRRSLITMLAAELATVVAVGVVVGTALVAATDASGAMGELVALDGAALAVTVPLLVAGAAATSLGAFRRAGRVDPLAVVWGGPR